MCDLTHLSSAISPVATTYRCTVGPFDGMTTTQGPEMTRTPPRWPAFREHLERTSSESDLMTHLEHFTYLTHLKRELHTYSTAHIYIYIYIYIYTYIYIYIYIYIYMLCVCTEPHHAQRFNANTANTQAICKNAFYVGWWVKAGTAVLFNSMSVYQ